MHAAGEGEEQSHRVVRHGVVQQTRREGNDHAFLRCSRDINGVVAHAPPRDEFEAGGFFRSENGGGELVHAGEDGVHARQEREEFGLGERTVFRRVNQLAAGIAQEFEGATSDCIDVERARSDEDFPGHEGGWWDGIRET